MQSSNNFDMGSISNIGYLITLKVTNRRREGGGEGEGVGWCEARETSINAGIWWRRGIACGNFQKVQNEKFPLFSE